MAGHRRSASVLSVASSLADLSISHPTRFIPAIDGTLLMEVDELDTHATRKPDDTQMAHPQDPHNDDAGHLNDSDSSGGFTDHAPAGVADDSTSSGGFTDQEDLTGGIDADSSSGGFTDDAGPAGATSDSDSSGGFTDKGAAEAADDTDSSSGFTDEESGDENPQVTPLQFVVDGETRWEDVHTQHAKWTQSAANEWRAMPAGKRYTNNVALAPSLEQRSALPRAKANHNFEVPGPGEVIELSDDNSPPVQFPGNSLTEQVFQHSRIQKKTHSGLSEHGHPVSGELAPAEYTQWLRRKYDISPTCTLGSSFAFPPPAGILYHALASATKQVGPYAETYKLSFSAGAAELCREEVAIAIANRAAANAISGGMAALTALLP